MDRKKAKTMSNPTNDKQLEELRPFLDCISVGTSENVKLEVDLEKWQSLFLANREQYAAEKVREELIKLSLTQKQKDNIEKRAYAFKLSQLGFSYGKIGKVMGVGKSTIQFWLRKQTNPNQGDKSE